MNDLLPFLRKGAPPVKNEELNEEPKTRSVILPVYLWEVLDKDAKRCRRSATKQIEAILVRYYGLESNVGLDEESLTEAVNIMSKQRQKKIA